MLPGGAPAGGGATLASGAAQAATISAIAATVMKRGTMAFSGKTGCAAKTPGRVGGLRRAGGRLAGYGGRGTAHGGEAAQPLPEPGAADFT